MTTGIRLQFPIHQFPTKLTLPFGFIRQHPAIFIYSIFIFKTTSKKTVFWVQKTRNSPRCYLYFIYNIRLILNQQRRLSMRPPPSQDRFIPSGLFAMLTYQRVYNAIAEASLTKPPPITLRWLKDRYSIIELIPESRYLSTLLGRSRLATRIYYGNKQLAYRNYIHGPLLREACALLAVAPPAVPLTSSNWRPDRST